MWTHRCTFEFKGKLYDVVGNWGVEQFENGFWVTATMELGTHALDRYWIPPSQIKHVEKLVK